MIDNTSQIYIVVDIEADGPVPNLHSMLSLAAVATTADKELGSFYRKLEPLPNATREANTMRWWKTEPAAWEEVNKDREKPESVMRDFCQWIKSFGLEPIFVSSPVALDYTFISWYLYRYAGENPFSNDKNATRTIDLRSYIAGKYGLTFNASTRTKLPSSLTKGMPAHTHKAIDDAIGYGVLLRKVLKTSSL